MTDSLDPVERFRLPFLPDLPGIFIVGRAMREAVERRTGCVVVGPKATGKTTGKLRGLGRFQEDELAFQSADPERYRARFVLEAHGVVGRTAREFYLNLLDRVQPGASARALRLRRDEEQVRRELIAALRQRRVVLLVFDEAEKLSDDAIEAVRALVADAEQGDDARRAALLEGASVPVGGVGVVLIGTPDLEARLAKTGELGNRWSTCDQVPDLPPDEVPDLYARVFPAFETHIATLGPGGWLRYIEGAVTRRRPMPLRVFDSHCRGYYGAMVDSRARETGTVLNPAAVTFDAVLFIKALSRIKW